MHHPDFCIAGAGIIGLSLALELHRRGASVTVVERNLPLTEASYAAAGMLAAHDPENPHALQPLSDLSHSLYPGWLDRLEALSRLPVAFQTHVTLQAHPTLTPLPTERVAPYLHPGAHTFQILEEESIDPRQLAESLVAAVKATSIGLELHSSVEAIRPIDDSIEVQTSTERRTVSHFIDCTGAWATTSSSLAPHAVFPRKGQMLAVALPPALSLDVVVRTPEIYIVPRTEGPSSGRAIIGATVEDRGFDKTVHSADIARLHAKAAELLPHLASAPILESWAGLRPATRDGLPLLGAMPHNPRHLLATGHYRNGILLAPASAHLLGQLLFGEDPSVDLDSYSPARIAALT